MATTHPRGEPTSARRPHGSGSITVHNGAYVGMWRVAGRQVKRKIGPVRTPHLPDGLTKTQAEARLRELIRETQASAPLANARTVGAAMDAWLAHLEAMGIKASSVRAYRAALDGWFLPTLKTRSLDRVTTADVELVMARMRKSGLAAKTIRNYVGVFRALFNFAGDRRRRWTTRR
jgi:Phage integrase, N-terminal SAM-like domain